MSTILSDHCPQCGETIDHYEHAQRLQCRRGHDFLVAEFVSERHMMEQTVAERDSARENENEVKDGKRHDQGVFINHAGEKYTG